MPAPPPMPPGGPDDLGARLDELRRRLYRPGATDDDRRRYARLARLEADRPEPPETTTRAGRSTGPSGRARAAGWSPAALALLAVVAVIGLTTAHSAGARRPTATASVAPAAAAPQPTAVYVPLEGRRVTGQRFRGRGPATVTLITGDAPLSGGRMVVSLGSSARAALGWRVERPAALGAGPSTRQVVASSPEGPRAPGGTDETVDYGGGPPDRVTILGAARTDWTLTVVFLAPGT